MKAVILLLSLTFSFFSQTSDYLLIAQKAEKWISVNGIEKDSLKTWAQTPSDSTFKGKNLSFTEVDSSNRLIIPKWSSYGKSYEKSLVSDLSNYLFINSLSDPSYAVVYQEVPSDFASSKSLQISANIKTEDFNNGFATIWARVDGFNRMIKYIDLDSLKIQGSALEKEYSIKINVPANSLRVRFGAYCKGTGKAWFSNFKVEPGKINVKNEFEPETESSLYSGSSGIVLFYLELFSLTSNNYYLNEAIKGGELIRKMIPDTLKNNWQTGLYYNISSAAFTMERLYFFTKKEHFKRAAFKALKLLNASVKTVGKGYEWNQSNDVLYGSSGTGLLFLYMYKKFKDPEYLLIAERVGLRLEELSLKEEEGISWKMDRNYEKRMPNFSHGTAGIAFFLQNFINKRMPKSI